MIQIDSIVWLDFNNLSQRDFNMAFDKKSRGKAHSKQIDQNII